MRLHAAVMLLVVAPVVDCSADHPTAVTSQTPAAQYKPPIDLSTTGAAPLFESSAVAINDSGLVVGHAQVTASDKRKAIVWRPPEYRYTVLPDLGASGTSFATSVGNDGTIGGAVCDSDALDSPCHPAYWRNGVLHLLGGVGQVNGVCPCDGHTLVGRIVVNGFGHGAIWEDDVLIDVGLPDANRANSELVAISGGFIVGMANNYLPGSPNDHIGFRWSHTEGWVNLGFESSVRDVNAHGTAVGDFATLWPDGSITPSFVIGGAGVADRINDADVVAGECVLALSATHSISAPCLWTAATGWTAISADSLASARDLNNSNVVVGDSFSFADNREFALLWMP